jgi:hypothetical protein
MDEPTRKDNELFKNRPLNIVLAGCKKKQIIPAEQTL